MSWRIIFYKNGQRICSKINFNLEANDLDPNEQKKDVERVESLDLNTASENLNQQTKKSAIDVKLNKSNNGTKATSIYLRDNLEDKGIIEIFSLIKQEWFSWKDVDLSLSRLKGPAFIIVFIFWILR